ncbi:hypothetical protein FN846DRAFT_930603, partial [Sphaerosporella brunnea]
VIPQLIPALWFGLWPLNNITTCMLAWMYESLSAFSASRRFLFLPWTKFQVENARSEGECVCAKGEELPLQAQKQMAQAPSKRRWI